MADQCWKPSSPLPPSWADGGCEATIHWTPNALSTSIACYAVACLAVACTPEVQIIRWEDTDEGAVYVCGEGPSGGIPEGGEGGAPPSPVYRAFSSGFSRSFD